MIQLESRNWSSFIILTNKSNLKHVYFLYFTQFLHEIVKIMYKARYNVNIKSITKTFIYNIPIKTVKKTTDKVIE